ncbi:MAG: patatin-like phospholipase family protein [Caldilineaceae bacterium]|nr:patatin-like phospholipase family protein [Caldilineaceae bacterium]
MKYDLVFEGGGAKGIALSGAYAELAQQGHSFGRLLGTSAGAITAAFLAAGYTPDEMQAVLTEQDAAGKPVFASFMGEPPPFAEDEIEQGAFRRLLGGVDLTFIPNFVENALKDQLANAVAANSNTRNFLALVERGGWYSAHNFLTWLRAKMDTGEVDGKPRKFSALTLAEFYAATKVDVTFCATDTTGARQLVLNHRTAPHCPLVYAVRMSMSIPLLWDEVIWDKSWGPYHGRDITGHTIVDGGVLSNFPLELFVSDAPFVTAVMGPKQNNPVLGLLLDDAAPVPTPRGLLVKVTIKPGDLATVQRLRGLVDTMLGARDKQVMEAFADLVVALPAGGYGTTEFDMSEPKRNALLEAARATMRSYLAAHPPLPAAAGLTAPKSPQVQGLADALANRLLAPSTP